MDELDVRIKEYLDRERKTALSGERPGAYPAVEDFFRFIMEELRGEELERMLRHLKAHPEDQAFVAQARTLLEEEEESKTKAKNLLKKITKIVWGQEKQKIIIEDPTGNSAIISDKAIKSPLKVKKGEA